MFLRKTNGDLKSDTFISKPILLKVLRSILTLKAHATIQG
jgi:hypothetical protein